MGLKVILRNIVILFLSILSGMPAVLSQVREPKLNFGAKAGIDYAMIGTNYSRYSGIVMPELGMFLSYHPGNNAAFAVEAGYSGTGFREQQNETKYRLDCIDLSAYSFLYPSKYSTDFAFVFGLRPSVVISHETETFQSGSYLLLSDPRNTNRNGQVDVGALFGFSLALSPVVNLELLYQASLTSKNSTTVVRGKPSTIEFGLRINALGFQAKQVSRAEQLRQQTNYMHDGVMLVMLPTPNKIQVEEMRKMGGRDGDIAVIENAYNVNNKTIISEFRREFNFCKLYFFMDYDAGKVVAGQPYGIFVDDNLQPDPSISIDSAHFFVSSICMDISDYTQRMQLGLYVYDEKMAQMQRPFNPNLIDFMNEGNPLNYVNGRKSVIYNPLLLRKKIKKLNTRLFRLMR